MRRWAWLSLALWACSRATPDDAAELPREAPSSLPVAARESPTAVGPGMLGVVVPRREVRLATDQIARIREITVAPGDVVRAGAKVVLLDDRAEQSELRSALASVRAAEAEARRLALHAERSASEVQRAERLTGILSDDELRNLQHDRGSAALGSRRAGADAAERRAQAEGIAQRIDQATLVCPFDGVVVERFASPGAVVAPGEPIVHVISEDAMIRFAADERELDHLAVGAAVHVVFPGLGIELDTTVEHVAPEIDAGTRIVMIEAPLVLGAAQRAKVRVGAIVRVHAAANP
jgi:multidrug efflux pump subunit AcrA (membrane-fusion protein)